MLLPLDQVPVTVTVVLLAVQVVWAALVQRKQNRSCQKTTETLDNLRARTPTGIEVIFRVLVDQEIGHTANAWLVVSHPVWQAHAREYSALRTYGDTAKYDLAYSKGRYLQQLSKAKS